MCTCGPICYSCHKVDRPLFYFILMCSCDGLKICWPLENNTSITQFTMNNLMNQKDLFCLHYFGFQGKHFLKAGCMIFCTNTIGDQLRNCNHEKNDRAFLSPYTGSVLLSTPADLQGQPSLVLHLRIVNRNILSSNVSFTHCPDF